MALTAAISKTISTSDFKRDLGSYNLRPLVHVASRKKSVQLQHTQLRDALDANTLCVKNTHSLEPRFIPSTRMCAKQHCRQPAASYFRVVRCAL